MTADTDTLLVDVMFVGAAGNVFHEKHACGDTLSLTINLTLERFPGAIAAFPLGDRWVVRRWVNARNAADVIVKTKYYPTQEAAEMVAIHNG